MHSWSACESLNLFNPAFLLHHMDVSNDRQQACVPSTWNWGKWHSASSSVSLWFSLQNKAEALLDSAWRKERNGRTRRQRPSTWIHTSRIFTPTWTDTVNNSSARTAGVWRSLHLKPESGPPWDTELNTFQWCENKTIDWFALILSFQLQIDQTEKREKEALNYFFFFLLYNHYPDKHVIVTSWKKRERNRKKTFFQGFYMSVLTWSPAGFKTATTGFKRVSRGPMLLIKCI